MNKYYPYKASILSVNPSGEATWWPISSNSEDEMVIGDGIPGDKQSAELCARCCRIAYEQALEDVNRLLKEKGIVLMLVLR